MKINKSLQEKKHWENIKSKKWCLNRSLAWILQNRTRQWWWLRHASAQRGAFCHFSHQWIYYCHSSKSNWQNAPLCSDVAVILWGSCLSKIYRGGPAHDQVTEQIKSIDYFVGSIFVLANSLQLLVGSASNSLDLKSVVMLLFYTAATALPRALDKKNLAPIWQL